MLALVSVLIAATHPALFFGSADVPALREAELNPHAAIAPHIEAILSARTGDPAPPAPKDWAIKSRSGPSAIS